MLCDHTRINPESPTETERRIDLKVILNASKLYFYKTLIQMTEAIDYFRVER